MLRNKGGLFIIAQGHLRNVAKQGGFIHRNRTDVIHKVNRKVWIFNQTSNKLMRFAADFASKPSHRHEIFEKVNRYFQKVGIR